MNDAAMPCQADTARARAVKKLLASTRQLIQVRNLEWKQVTEDYRLLVINHVLRRQMEAIDAALALAAADLGHHAVSFVRSALEESMWVGYLVSLERAMSQRLLLALSQFDTVRSLLAQRKHIGDEGMTKLWYSEQFLADVEAGLPVVEASLKQLRAELGWTGRLPSGDWIAEQVDTTSLYEYLHSATSRAVHFSAGEIFRRGWGNPAGFMVTDKPEFRLHLSEFALDQLWRLLWNTIGAARPLLATAGISSTDVDTDEGQPRGLRELLRLGRVPLVHAAEWNLTPHGPIRFTTSPSIQPRESGADSA